MPFAIDVSWAVIDLRKGDKTVRAKRAMALAAITLAGIGTLGVAGAKAYAQTTAVPSAQVRAVPVQSKQLHLKQYAASSEPTAIAPTVTEPAVTEMAASEPGASEPAATGVETDTVQLQSVYQAGSNDVNDTADQGPDQQRPQLNGSITVPQTAGDSQNDAAEAATLAGLAKISVEQARAAVLAANGGTTVVKASLDNENGTLIYSVELSNGSDVKVDAGNGQILATDIGDAENGGQAQER